MKIDPSSVPLVWSLYCLGFHYSAWILPALLYSILRRRFGRVGEGVIALALIGGIWLLLNVYQERTFLIRMAYRDHLNPDSTNDGQADDAVIYLLGWVPPFLSIIAAIALPKLAAATRRFFKVRRAQAGNLPF